MDAGLPVATHTSMPGNKKATVEVVHISLLLPTRGRPELAKRFLQSVVDTAEALHAVEVILYVDDDDTGSHHLDGGALHTERIIGPKQSMGVYNTSCYRASKGQIIVLVNDDMVIRTVGWDTALRAMDERFSDRIYLGYCNDLLKKGGLATFPILSRKTCELLVDPYPAAYAGAFIDVHLFDIFKRLQHQGFDRFIYLDDVIFEHLHYRTGKAAYDDTYKQRGRFQDDSIFIRLSSARSDAAKRLLRALKGQPAEAATETAVDVPLATGRSSSLFYFKRLFLDFDLPLRWRTYLWIWFTLRHSAAHGLLRFVVKGGGETKLSN
ncbi:hypothetical protein ACVW0Y_000045 [Pseudomonas sp. TE3786]